MKKLLVIALIVAMTMTACLPGAMAEPRTDIKVKHLVRTLEPVRRLCRERRGEPAVHADVQHADRQER